MPRRGNGGCLQGFAAGLGFGCGNQVAGCVVSLLVVAGLAIYVLLSGQSK